MRYTACMGIVEIAIDVVEKFILPVLFSGALALFVWGVLMYILQGKYDEEIREKGKAVMVYGIFVFMVMFLAWGLLRIVTG
jgi:hypothetical protein